MFLKRIILTNFKNIASADLRFSPKINCIYGDNGVGKTNLLDAIYYLSMTKSFFLNSDQYVVRYQTDQATLFGSYSLNEDGTEDTVAVSIARDGAKMVRRNGKSYSRFSEHIGLIPIVIVSPSDTSLIIGSGEERRRLMNSVLSQTDKEYLRRIQSYNKLISQRNRLLKSERVDRGLLSVLSEQLSAHAAYIYEKRKELVDVLNGKVMEYYSPISGERETVSLQYESDLSKAPLDRLLDSAYARDVALKYTSVGIQRDDLIFLMDGHSMKKSASQGQQKSFLISLKLSQFSLVRNLMKVPPILLLDDLFDKLDLKRVRYLIDMVSRDNFGQIFITDSDRDRVHNVVGEDGVDSAFFPVKDGTITQENR